MGIGAIFRLGTIGAIVMRKHRKFFSNRITYITNVDLKRTEKKLRNSQAVSYGPELSKRGYEFGLRRFKGSMIQLSQMGKLNIWFKDYEFLEKELAAIRKLLIPKRGEELQLSLPEREGQKFVHNLRGVFWALFPSILENKLMTSKPGTYAPGSIESQLSRVTAPYELADHILGIVQDAMNDAWNRGNPDALFFLKSTAYQMRNLIDEAIWAKKRGFYLMPLDQKVLAKSKKFSLSEILEHNRLKIEQTKGLSPTEIKKLEKFELRKRANWIRTNQPWRINIYEIKEGSAFIPSENNTDSSN